jgi:hypothetical protein
MLSAAVFVELDPVLCGGNLETTRTDSRQNHDEEQQASRDLGFHCNTPRSEYRYYKDETCSELEILQDFAFPYESIG